MNDIIPDDCSLPVNGVLPKKSRYPIQIMLGAQKKKKEYAILIVDLDRMGDGPDVPAPFVYDGGSVWGLLRGLFPKWRHPAAVCGHDYDCKIAKNDRERKIADKRFERKINATRSIRAKLEAKIGYIGVRIGAFFGIGSRYG